MENIPESQHEHYNKNIKDIEHVVKKYVLFIAIVKEFS